MTLQSQVPEGQAAWCPSTQEQGSLFSTRLTDHSLLRGRVSGKEALPTGAGQDQGHTRELPRGGGDPVLPA